MKLLFSVEASPGIGHGHVMRCCALADAAKDFGFAPAFSPANAYTRELLLKFGRRIASPDRICDSHVVVDHHSDVNSGWINRLKAAGSVVMLLDWKGAARTEANLVCDALMTPKAKTALPYNLATRYLYGLEYALLREQFRRCRGIAQPGRSKNPRLLIAMGGRDQHAVSPRLVSALDASGYRGPAMIVAEGGSGVAGKAALEKLTDKWSDTKVLVGVKDMASLMSDCDLVVSKIGGTALEAMCIGIAGVMIEPSPAHFELTSALAKIYPDWPMVELGLANEIDMRKVADQILGILGDPEFLRSAGQHGVELIDGLGCRRVLKELLGEMDG